MWCSRSEEIQNPVLIGYRTVATASVVASAEIHRLSPKQAELALSFPHTTANAGCELAYIGKCILRHTKDLYPANEVNPFPSRRTDIRFLCMFVGHGQEYEQDVGSFYDLLRPGAAA